MLSEDVQIQFSGFEPNQSVRSALYFVLNKIHFSSPSQSFLTATFTLTNGIFEGMVKITHSTGDFVADATDTQVSVLANKLSEKVGSQLAKWKALRFQ